MKKKIITLAGKPGSGKSSAAKGVAKKLEYTHFSAGDHMRSVAKRHGLTINEVLEKAFTDRSIDKEVDGENSKLRDRDNTVVDGHVAYHFIPDSFKVYLDLDSQIAAERIYNDQHDGRQASGEAHDRAEKIHDLLVKRLDVDRERYQELYDIDIFDMNRFNLVIDTAKHNLEEVIDLIITEYEKWLAT